MWSKSGRGGGVGKGVRIVGERFEGKVGLGSRCSLRASRPSICNRDGRSNWCSRGRDSWRKWGMGGVGWSMVLTI